MGKNGSACVVDGKYIHTKCYKNNVVDTTAAGDTYVGGLMTRLSVGDSVDKAMDFAAKASCLTCSRKGAQQSIPYKEEVEKFTD